MRIGIIGYGNMGSAIAAGLKGRYEVLVFDKDKNKTQGLKGLAVASNSGDLANKAEVVFLAIKPQDFDWLLGEIKKQLKDKLVVSIAAGISTAHIEKILGNVRLIRAMPNIAAKIGESVTCICKGKNASDEDLRSAEELFYFLGTTKAIDESLMNAATAISGSGPGYIFDFMAGNAIDAVNVPEHVRHDLMRRLEQAAEAVGFNREDANFLAANTVNSSLSLIKKLKIPAVQLRDQVKSKGGTTEAGLEAIHKGGSWEEAAVAAVKRAEQLTRR